jgi:hypothetical protein
MGKIWIIVFDEVIESNSGELLQRSANSIQKAAMPQTFSGEASSTSVSSRSFSIDGALGSALFHFEPTFIAIREPS